jgi:hypothetical protein
MIRLLVGLWLMCGVAMLLFGAWLWRDRMIRGWTWRRLARIGVAIWATAMWLLLSSIIALFMAGRPGLIGTVWWWDLLPWIGDPWTLRVVLASAVIAAAIVGGALGIRLLARGRRGTQPEKTLYGTTEWASRDQLGEGGFRKIGGMK